MAFPLSVARLLLVAAVPAGVLLGLWVPGHLHKILVSIVFGVSAGVLWRYAWHRVKKQSPDILDQVRRNVAEAQETLRDSFSWKLGAGRPVLAPGSRHNLEEVLSDGISIVVTACLAAMVWVLPVFWEPPGTAPLVLAKAAGAHLFALCCVAAAMFGVLTRLGSKPGRAL